MIGFAIVRRETRLLLKKGNEGADMGFSPDGWMHAHMSSVLWMVEVLWVAGFLAVFVFYLMIKRRIKKKKTAAAEKNKPIE